MLAKIGSYITASTAMAVALDGDYAYIADLFDIQVVDISDPQNPILVTSFEMEQAKDIAVVDGYVYVVDGLDGLFIFEALQE
jgi:hypothetical protein